MVLRVSARYIAGIVVRIALLFSATDYLRLITQPLQRYLSTSTPPFLHSACPCRQWQQHPCNCQSYSSTGCIIAVCARHGALGSQLHASLSPKINTALQLPVPPTRHPLTHPEDTSSASLRRHIQHFQKPLALPQTPCCRHLTHVNPRHKYSPAPQCLATSLRHRSTT